MGRLSVADPPEPGKHRFDGTSRWQPIGPGGPLLPYVPDPELLREQKDRLRRRGWFVAGIGLLLLLSLVLPHVHLTEQSPFGRSLLLTGFYFLHAQAGEFPPPVDVPQLAFGLNVTYLGIGLHELGLLLSAATFWTLYPDDINRWLYRMLLVGAWLLALSVPFLLTGAVLMAQSGVAVSLGVAWLPLLASGVLLVVAALRARGRIDRTWYSAAPELM